MKHRGARRFSGWNPAPAARSGHASPARVSCLGDAWRGASSRARRQLGRASRPFGGAHYPTTMEQFRSLARRTNQELSALSLLACDIRSRSAVHCLLERKIYGPIAIEVRSRGNEDVLRYASLPSIQEILRTFEREARTHERLPLPFSGRAQHLTVTVELLVNYLDCERTLSYRCALFGQPHPCGIPFHSPVPM